MYKMLVASFGIIQRRIPSRSFLRELSSVEALGVYVLTTVLGLIELFFPALTNTEFGMLKPIGFALIENVLGLLITLVIGKWIINRYAKDKFSFKEMFVLQVLLTSASSIVFSISWVASVLFGEAGAVLVGLPSIIFGIYMLLTFQKAIREIASITTSQAAYVILAPIGVLLIGWVVFLSLAGGIAVVSR